MFLLAVVSSFQKMLLLFGYLLVFLVVMLMNDEKFCCVDNYMIQIPLRDYNEIMQTLKNLPEYEKQVQSCIRQLSALRGMFEEALEKIKELQAMI